MSRPLRFEVTLLQTLRGEGAKRLATAMLLCVPCGACTNDFAPPSAVTSLRVLGVQKSEPFPAPGELVELSMLWHDGQTTPAAPASAAWSSSVCVNPEGDLYYSCFPGLRDASLSLVRGDQFSFQVPDDILSSRPRLPSGEPTYGSAYAFFALCRGKLEVFPDAAADKLPLICRDDVGTAVGPDDFVAGYVTLYVYPEAGASEHFVRNKNPVLGGLDIAGVAAPVCIGADGQSQAAPPCVAESGQSPLEDALNCDDPSNSARCFDACSDDGGSSCEGISIKPLIDPSVVESDEIAVNYYHRDVTEQMWIDYYADRGAIDSPVRLLNDATNGWNPEFGTVFRAPSSAGPVTIWAVVHDNRGGTNWVRTQVGIRVPR